MNDKLIKQLMEADIFKAPTDKELVQRRADRRLEHEKNWQRLTKAPLTKEVLEEVSDLIFHQYYDSQIPSPTEDELIADIQDFLWSKRGITPTHAKQIARAYVYGLPEELETMILDELGLSESLNEEDVFAAPSPEEVGARRIERFEQFRTQHRAALDFFGITGPNVVDKQKLQLVIDKFLTLDPRLEGATVVGLKDITSGNPAAAGLGAQGMYSYLANIRAGNISFSLRFNISLGSVTPPMLSMNAHGFRNRETSKSVSAYHHYDVTFLSATKVKIVAFDPDALKDTLTKVSLAKGEHMLRPMPVEQVQEKYIVKVDKKPRSCSLCQSTVPVGAKLFAYSAGYRVRELRICKSCMQQLPGLM